jgi:membrane-bound lytic murein transglycosylase D
VAPDSRPADDLNGHLIDAIEQEKRGENADIQGLSTSLGDRNEIQIPEEMAEVRKWVDYLLSGKRGSIRTFIARMEQYLPLVEPIVRREGLPEEIVYLPILESGYNPMAGSRAGAVGIWQFMSGTARKYGLNVNWWVDERRDPVRATEAACRYLRDLYLEFEDWELALAAYNSGEGRIRRKISAHHTRDFWRLSAYLPRETRGFVPGFYASVLIGRDPKKYGIVLEESERRTFHCDTVTLPEPVDLALLAEWSRTSVDEIRRLNPQFKRWATCPRTYGFGVRIPKGSREYFLVSMTDTPREQWFSMLAHRVRSGETLSHLAEKYGVSVRTIAAINSIRNPNRVRTGQILQVPAGGGSRTHEVIMASLAPLDSEGSYRTYTVVRGDTLWAISRRFGISISKLRQINNISNPSRIRPGQKLKIPS